MAIRLPASPPPTVLPDVRLVHLLDQAATSVRSAPGIYTALGRAVEQVGQVLRWPVGHAWIVDSTGAWRSAGVWYDADPDTYTPLGVASLETPPGVARGHLALALHMAVPEWTNDLDLCGARAAVAIAAGLRGAVAAPVVIDGKPIALLEWFLDDATCPSPDTVAALSKVGSYVAEVGQRRLVAAG